MARFAAAAALAAVAAVAGAGAAQAPGRIVFESDRAALAAHDGLYTVGIDGTHRRRLVANVDGTLFVHWSPDGRRIAYYQVGTIRVVAAGGGKPRIVGRTDGDTRFSWSPDGTRIAYFVDAAERALVVVRFDGTKAVVRRLRTDGDPGVAPAWSPNGREIAYNRFTDRSYSMNIIDVATGRDRVLLKGVAGGALAWSPDGRTISYDDGTSIFLVDVATHARRVLRNAGRSATWSPDSTKLAVIQNDVGVLDLRTGRRAHVSSHAESGDSGNHYVDSVAWLPGSRRLVVPVNNDVAVVDADGHNLRLLTHNGNAFALKTDPSPAPDGRRVAYVAERQIAGDADLYSMRPDGSDVRSLTRNSLGEADPAWSPDRSRVAFVREFGLTGDIRVMTAGGETSRSLGAGFHPAWAPDGHRLAFTRDGDLYTVDADGGDAQLLVGGPTFDFDPAWSPDGTRIAFARRSAQKGAPADVWVAAADGSGAVQVTHVGDATDSCRTKEAFSPAWSPDGTEIAYVAAVGENSTCTFLAIQEVVRAIRPDGTGDRLVTDGHVKTEGGASDPTWSPDGRQLAISVATQFEVNDEFTYRIDVVDRDGHNEHVVARDAQDPDWR
jgi:Tol biopolymer transport system component